MWGGRRGGSKGAVEKSGGISYLRVWTFAHNVSLKRDLRPRGPLTVVASSMFVRCRGIVEGHPRGERVPISQRVPADDKDGEKGS